MISGQITTTVMTHIANTFKGRTAPRRRQQRRKRRQRRQWRRRRRRRRQQQQQQHTAATAAVVAAPRFYCSCCLLLSVSSVFTCSRFLLHYFHQRTKAFVPEHVSDAQKRVHRSGGKPIQEEGD
jgi:hypothetical protein